MGELSVGTPASRICSGVRVSLGLAVTAPSDGATEPADLSASLWAEQPPAPSPRTTTSPASRAARTIMSQSLSGASEPARMTLTLDDDRRADTAGDPGPRRGPGCFTGARPTPAWRGLVVSRKSGSAGVQERQSVT